MKSNSGGKAVRYNKWGYIFLIPFIVVFVIFQLVPLVNTIYNSFFENYMSGLTQVGPRFVGLDNYKALFSSGDIWTYFKNTMGVSVRYVSSVQELGQPDMIFLPGSKNTMGDLRWMRQNGLEAAVKKLAAHIPVWGICGGYQMLGRTISDPHGVENENSLREPLYPAHCEAISHEPDTIAVERIKRDGALPLRGMELIDTDTTLMPEKMRTQTRGKYENVTGIFSTLSGLEFSGYEIHMGKTTVSTGEHQTPLVQLADGRTDGVQRMEKGSEALGVYGSYVHGIFDDGDIAVRIVQALADKKKVSWKPEAGGDYHAFKEQQYDKLAQGLREHLDMEYVYSSLQESRISS